MEISKALRLVLPVQTVNGQSFVHARAIERETFHQYFDVMVKAFTQVYNGGAGLTAGPRVAALYLRQAATQMGRAKEVEDGLIAEMVRLANVSVCGPRVDGGAPAGWDMIPLDEAIKKGLLDPDEKDEVENALAFFTLASSLHKKTEREPILIGAMSLWAGRITSSDFTEFVASLPTSTETASSGERAPVSSVPC